MTAKFTLLPSQKSLVAFIIFLFAFIFIYPSIFDVKLFLGGDNCNYYILADGLSSGQGYVNNNEPFPTAANHFPPGYPFIMSLFMRIGIESIVSFKLINGLFLLGTIFVFYRIVYRITKNQFLSIVLGLLVLLNAHFLEYSTVMMSELPFAFFQLLSIHLLIRWSDNEYSLKSVFFVLFVLTLILSIYIRSIGITMLGTSFLYLLFSRKYVSSLALLGITILALLPWQIRSSNLGGSSYMKSLVKVDTYDPASESMKLSDWGERVKLNAWRYASKEIPNSVFPKVKVEYRNPKTGDWISSPTKHWILGFGIILLGLIGLLTLKHYRWLFLLIFGSNFFILMLWPQVWFGIRFMLPIVPLILLFSVLGIYFIIEKVFPKYTNLRTSPYISAFFLILAFTHVEPIKKLVDKKEADYPANWKNYIRLAEWTSENLKDAVVSTRKPEIFFVAGGASTCNFPYTPDRKEFLDGLKKKNVTHVVFESLGFSQTGKFLFPVIKSDDQQFKMVKSFGVVERKDKDGNILPSPAGVWLFEFNPNFGYSGEYKNGIREGKGKYNYRDGRTVEGTWKNDTLSGPGTFVDKNKRTYVGSWEKGKMEGTFIIKEKGKPSIESFWVDNKPVPDAYVLDSNGKRLQQIKLK